MNVHECPQAAEKPSPAGEIALVDWMNQASSGNQLPVRPSSVSRPAKALNAFDIW